MIKKILFLTGVALLFLVGMVVFFNREVKPQTYSGPHDPIRIGTITEYSTLMRVAEWQGFFERNGLTVTRIEYSSGAPAMKGLLDDEVDITSAADFVGVRHIFERGNFQVLLSMFESLKAFELVARKDHGITEPIDLRGKTIGLSKKTMGEFFLGTFLNWHNLSLDDVTQIDAPPPELASKIASGELDAVATFNPHSYTIAKTLGNNAMVTSIHNNKSLYGLAYAKRSFIEQNPDIILRFVKALADAEQFVATHPDEMKEFFVKEFNYSNDYIENIVSQMRFKLSLEQAMMVQMENEARFIIDKGLTTKTTVPNFLDFIYFDALEAVKPRAITILH